MSDSLHEVGAAVPLCVMGGIVLERSPVQEHGVPNNQRETEIQRKRNVSGTIRLSDCGDPMQEIVVQYCNVGIADLGVGRKRHGWIKTTPILGDTSTHRSGKIFDAVRTDAGFPVRRNVGGINPPHGSHQRATPGEPLAAGSRVAGSTARGPGQIEAWLHGSIGRRRRFSPRNRRRQDEKGAAPKLGRQEFFPSHPTSDHCV